MEKTRFEKQIRFILETDKLKKVLRRNLLADGSRRENSAEHSWHIALSVMIFAEHANEKGLDLARVTRMLIVHDLVEIDAGDTYCYDDVGRQDQQDRETRAAERIFNLLPDDQAGDLYALWAEFEARATPESKFANALDRIHPFLNNYVTDGVVWRENRIHRDQVLERMRPVADGSTGLWEYVLQLIEEAVNKGYLLK